MPAAALRGAVRRRRNSPPPPEFVAENRGASPAFPVSGTERAGWEGTGAGRAASGAGRATDGSIDQWTGRAVNRNAWPKTGAAFAVLGMERAGWEGKQGRAGHAWVD